MSVGDGRAAEDAAARRVGAELARTGGEVRERFLAQRRVLSFAEYLALVAAHPLRHARDAATYLRDAFDHFGSYTLERPWGAGGKVRRWALFDLPFAGEARAANERLVGHEALQNDVYQALQSFCREGRPNRLLLLHGPNGSAKSTFAACLMAALEAYSRADEGALYRFSWVFPRGEKGKGIGFRSGDGSPAPGESYAHLPEERIDAKLPSELRESPLLLLPGEPRRRLLAEALEAQGTPDARVPERIARGSLGHRNRAIFDALLTACRGDLARVLAHVQVERWEVSRRYRQGAVTIGPEMAADAGERQLTADRSLGSLPASLSALSLYETQGELVDGQGGLIEYSDLLKRPLDAWKYLLLAIETGEVALQRSTLALDSVLLASSNELHLRAFQEHPDYHSFRGRLVRLRVPYLRDVEQEKGIYEAQITPQIRLEVAPHVTYVGALWAVLTRLRRANADRYDDREIGKLAADLTPLEKAQLYANGAVPRRFEGDQAKLLRAGAEAIYGERHGGGDYEGLVGASPREMRMLFLDAVASAETDGCLAPPALLDRLEAFCERDDYEFLKLAPDRGYHDAKAFVAQARECWLDRVDEELRTSTGLVSEDQVRELFEHYVLHASHWVKKERVRNPVTGELEAPDEELLSRVEEQLGAGEGPAFRRDLMSAVANWAIEHPGEEAAPAVLFPRHLETLGEAHFRERRRQLRDLAEDVLAHLRGRTLEANAAAAAERTVATLESRFGYGRAGARIALGALLAARYADE
ncbi:MAG: serine protein kinase PrkA [Myxococcota bacterium]